MGFKELWESAPGLLGWAVLRRSKDPGLLVQVRGTERLYSDGMVRQVILLKADDGSLAEILKIENANNLIELGVLHADVAEVDELGGGTRVAAVLGDDVLGVYRTNGAHAGIILDRLAAREITPTRDLLACLEGTPGSEERLSRIELEPTLEESGIDRMLSTKRRLARLNLWLETENLRLESQRLFEEGKEDEADALLARWVEAIHESVARGKEEFGGAGPRPRDDQ